jgi:SAM-dependent methyltransferase
MSHTVQLEFVQISKSIFSTMFVNQKVLEIGSLDINGSVRGFFEHCDYTGLDIGPGPGVDVVCQGQSYDAPTGSFDVVICCEVMEHNPFWQDTFRNMIRLLRPGGLMVMSCATTGRAEHGTTRSDPVASPLTIEKGWEYYRNLTAKDVSREVDLSELSSSGFVTEKRNCDLYMLGVKAGGGVDAADRIARFKAVYRQRAIRQFWHRVHVAIRTPSRIPIFLKRYMAQRRAIREHAR